MRPLYRFFSFNIQQGDAVLFEGKALAEDAVGLEIGVREGEVAVVGMDGDMLAKEHGSELAEGLCDGEEFLFGGSIAALDGI